MKYYKVLTEDMRSPADNNTGWVVGGLITIVLT